MNKFKDKGFVTVFGTHVRTRGLSFLQLKFRLVNFFKRNMVSWKGNFLRKWKPRTRALIWEHVLTGKQTWKSFFVE